MLDKGQIFFPDGSCILFFIQKIQIVDRIDILCLVAVRPIPGKRGGYMIADTAGMIRKENTGMTPFILTANTMARPIEI